MKNIIIQIIENGYLLFYGDNSEVVIYFENKTKLIETLEKVLPK